MGIDYSKKMIDLARRLENGRMHFHVGDITDAKSLRILRNPFDCVVSCRCLINLGTRTNQLRAIDNVYDLLTEDGLFVFCEGSKSE